VYIVIHHIFSLCRSLSHPVVLIYYCRRVTRYLEYRHPPWSVDRYDYTTQYWHIIASKFIFVVCFEVTHCKLLRYF